MCGESRIGTYHPDTLTQATQQGWLLKVDQNGCLVPGCQIIDDVDRPGAAPSRLKLYPNPASHYLHLFFDPGETASAGQFRIVDAHGRTMAAIDSLPGETTYLLSLEGYSPGVYFLQYLEKGQMTRAEPFVVNNK